MNVVAFAILQSGDRANLNIRGAALHVMGDMLGSIAAIAAALVILWTGWMPIDPILSVLVAVLILRGAFTVVRKSGHILLEGTPENVDPKAGFELMVCLQSVCNLVSRNQIRVMF